MARSSFPRLVLRTWSIVDKLGSEVLMLQWVLTNAHSALNELLSFRFRDSSTYDGIKPLRMFSNIQHNLVIFLPVIIDRT